MNYNHLNKVYCYWRHEILPHLSHNLVVSSFDDYIKRMSFLPSGKWIHDMENMKVGRVGFAVDPKKFVLKYKDNCVAFSDPMKPEDGLQRIVYQISPTLHIELGLGVWIEHDVLQAHGFLFACYGNKQEYLKFTDELYDTMRCEGDTEEKPTPFGFSIHAGDGIGVDKH